MKMSKNKSKIKQCSYSVKGLKKASLSSDISRVMMGHCTFLKNADVLLEIVYCSFQVPILESTEINFEQEVLFFVGDQVVQTIGFPWKGKIIKIENKRALIHWEKNSKDKWHPLCELYPLNEFGKRILPGRDPDIFRSARYGKTMLTRKAQPLNHEHTQLELL
jgi:hypothetical protein